MALLRLAIIAGREGSGHVVSIGYVDMRPPGGGGGDGGKVERRWGEAGQAGGGAGAQGRGFVTPAPLRVNNHGSASHLVLPHAGVRKAAHAIPLLET